ncbi:hypothetical protein CMV_018233 [Castanea mollissima]|uniref:Uncharacterized protein n=1 Tax=Castanea mollissima TaxID=60419 RepID=A0A8J4R2R6_9ROSI|nr:hypothetical protein CMV_018233 [Castanea mollissima]
MTLMMGGRSLKLLYAIFTLLLHLKPTLGVISGVGDGVECSHQTGHILQLDLQAGDKPTLRGRIPTGTQIQSFDSDRFTGNLGLCGPPLIENARIHCWFLGSLWLFDVKSFLETCIFPIDDQPEGLVVCDSSSAYYKIAEDVSQLEAITISLKPCRRFGPLILQLYFHLQTHVVVQVLDIT